MAPNIGAGRSQADGYADLASSIFGEQATAALELANRNPCSHAERCRHLRPRLVSTSRF